MKAAAKKTTRSNQTFQLLRDHILSGTIPAGSKLSINELCRQFGVSLGAVREALSQLLSEGLVSSEAHRGFMVTPISDQDLIDLTRVFSEINILCLTWAIQAGNVEWESNIMAAMHRLSKAKRFEADGKPTAEWKDAHHKFHYALIAACDSPRLLQIWQQLYEQSERYRRLNVPLPINQSQFSEYQQLTDAVLARDIPAATRHSYDLVNAIVNHVLKAMSGQTAPTRGATSKRSGASASAQSKNKKPARVKRAGKSSK